jgi:chitosanase
LLPLACSGGKAPPTEAGGSGGESEAASASGHGGTGGAAASESAPPPGACDWKDEKQFCACMGLTCGGDTVADKTGDYHTVYCGTCDPAQVCVARPSIAGGAVGACSAISGLNASQKKVAEQLTSLWENDTTTLAYGYAENIGDGRGYTSGRAGFCTGTGDAIVVLACYASVKPGNRMQKYLPTLAGLEDRFVKSLGKANQGATGALTGWINDWAASAADPAFKGCQDSVVDAVYYGIAMQHAAEKGFTTALAKASLYDAQINMGDDHPDYGVRAMMARADKVTGPIGNPPSRDEESKWLGNFLRIRAQIMYDDPQTWRTNMYRVANYERLRKAGNLDLGGCIKTGASAAAVWPGAGFTGTGGPVASVGACPVAFRSRRASGRSRFLP